jgi:hypothetical protein
MRIRNISLTSPMSVLLLLLPVTHDSIAVASIRPRQTVATIPV